MKWIRNFTTNQQKIIIIIFLVFLLGNIMADMINSSLASWISSETGLPTLLSYLLLTLAFVALITCLVGTPVWIKHKIRKVIK